MKKQVLVKAFELRSASVTRRSPAGYFQSRKIDRFAA
jgi:hypothetical protein